MDAPNNRQHQKERSVMSKVIAQEVVLDATPAQVYAAFMDSKQHSEFTGDVAVIGGTVGAAFSCHGGMVSGINVELVPNQRIVQAWRATPFPEGVYSVATFVFESAGEKKTRLKLTHEAVPAPACEMIAQGWEEHYWAKLKKYFKA
jgi:uncharacterized protein YndB with AHSA1/START domain